MIECNRTAAPLSLCQRHVKKLLTSNENYYKHMDVNTRIENQDNESVTEALMRVMGHGIPRRTVSDSPSNELSFSQWVTISPGIFILLVQMIQRIKLDIPVILCGSSGSGKSTLIRYIHFLYTECEKTCVIVSHNSLLQTQPELRAYLDNALVAADIVFLVVQVTSKLEVDDVMKMVNSRTVDGGTCPTKVKFLVEISPHLADHPSIDNHCVLAVQIDNSIIKCLLTKLSIPDYVYFISQTLLEKESVSYRNVITFIKVFSWVDQVFYNRHHTTLLSHFDTSSELNLKSATMLLLSLDLVCGNVPEDTIGILMDYFNFTSQKDKFVRSYSNFVAEVVYNTTRSRSSRLFHLISSYDINNYYCHGIVLEYQ